LNRFVHCPHLPIPLLKKYLDEIPESKQKFEWLEKQKIHYTSNDKIQYVAGELAHQIIQKREQDLAKYRTLLEQEIPKDYILTVVTDILYNYTERNWQDYDDDMMTDIEKASMLCGNLALIEKAKRNNLV